MFPDLVGPPRRAGTLARETDGDGTIALAPVVPWMRLKAAPQRRVAFRSADLCIREATAGDAEALAALSTQLGYPADSAAIATRLRNISKWNTGVLLVAESDAVQVLGFVQAVPQWYVTTDPCVHVASLVVDRETRGAGIGESLLRAVETWSRDHGLRELRVRSNVVRERAHHFYLRHGYVEKKRQAVFVKRL